MNTQQASETKNINVESTEVKSISINRIYSVRKEHFETFGITKSAEMDVVPLFYRKDGQIALRVLDYRNKGKGTYSYYTSEKNFNDCFFLNNLRSVLLKNHFETGNDGV